MLFILRSFQWLIGLALLLQLSGCFFLPYRVRPAARQFSPPGTVWLKDSLYMDETEVTVQAWQTYMLWLSENCGGSSAEFINAIPDTAAFWYDEKRGYGTVIDYMTREAYAEYPVVGITQEQAAEYCKWRTAMVLVDFEKKRNPLNSRYRYLIDLRYRLPTVAEWEYAAAGGLDSANYPYGYKSGVEHCALRYNRRPQDGLHFNRSSYFGKPNRYGLYNMIGNVAEMTQERGRAKGGSWYHKAAESKIYQSQSYHSPATWLGFRCVCEYDSQRDTLVRN